MTGILNLLGESVIPQVFGALDAAGLTERIEIIRTTNEPDNYGGHAETETVVSGEIPCQYIPKAGSQLVENSLWTRHLFVMPAVWEGEAIDIKVQDKIRMLERGAASPERLFWVKEFRNNGVKLEVDCTQG